jgi:hypothetical protein
LVARDRIQRESNHQSQQTSWMTSLKSIISDSFSPQLWPGNRQEDWDNDTAEPNEQTRENFLNDIDVACGLLLPSSQDVLNPPGPPLGISFVDTPHILVSPLTHCRFCVCNGLPVPLLKHKEDVVSIFTASQSPAEAYLITSVCPRYDAHYTQDSINCVTHGKINGFRCLSNTKPEVLVNLKLVLEEIGEGGGCVPMAKEHSCDECMKPKKYANPNVAGNQQGNPSAGRFAVAGMDGEQDTAATLNSVSSEDEAPTSTQNVPQNAGPTNQLVTRAMVMDGKTLTHKVSSMIHIHEAVTEML